MNLDEPTSSASKKPIHSNIMAKMKNKFNSNKNNMKILNVIIVSIYLEITYFCMIWLYYYLFGSNFYLIKLIKICVKKYKIKEICPKRKKTSKYVFTCKIKL